MASAYLVVYVAATWFAASSIYRLWKRRQSPVQAFSTSQRLHLILPAIDYALATVFVSIGILAGGRMFFVDETLTAIRTFAIALLFTSLLDVFASWSFPMPRAVRQSHVVISLFAVMIGVAFLAFVLWMRSTPGKESDAIRLSWPVKGSWRVVTGGRSRITNYHHNRPSSQNYAVDMVRTNGPSEGEAIYSPAQGSVVESYHDRRQGSAEAEGNLVIIRDDRKIEVWLAHLEKNSVRVKKGDWVRRGEEIAKCGATGSADVAHLHIHAQREGEPIPMLFGERKRFLLRDDTIE